MTLADNAERLVEQMSLKTREETDERILNDAFIEFDKSAPYTRTMKIRNKLVIKSLRIAAVAAMAVIIWSVYAALFTEKFLDTKQIYNNLAQNENFNISLYAAGQENPFRQVWASKSLEMTLSRTTEQNLEFLTLWDISRNNKMTKFTSESTHQTDNIAHNEMIAELEDSTFYAFSLARFHSIDDIPQNAKWAKIQSPDTNIFELSWHDKSSRQYFKLQIFLELDTNKLKRTELYVKSENENEYTLNSFGIITYPQQEEIKTVIRRNFEVVLSPPEYQPTGGM
ncbi:MAG: hypothetical protein JXA96_03025 [Sedimentisphaerales bacterium]|nr:hypothetical protein [Sedimentisphaerales bacterium]